MPCEVVWSCLEFANAGKVYIGSFYRPPKYTSAGYEPINQLFDSLSKVMQEVKNNRSNVLICGDFNFPDINWDDLQTKEESQRKKIHNDFLDFLHETGLTQVNKLITRPRSQNILDLICTSNPNIINNIRTESGISDHDILMFDLSVNPKRQNKPARKIYNFNKADSDNFKSMLREECDRFLQSNPELRSVDENWDWFKECIQKGIDKFVPHRMSKGKQSHPWIDRDLVRQMHKRDKLYSEAKKTKSQRLWNSYKRQRNFVTSQIRQAHHNYMEEVLGPSLETNPKKFWSFVRSQRREAVGIPTLSTNGTNHVTDSEKAEALNNQFSLCLPVRT